MIIGKALILREISAFFNEVDVEQFNVVTEA